MTIEGEEAVDWGVEDDLAAHDAHGIRNGAVDQTALSEGVRNSPPRTEAEDDAISLGEEDDDMEALMNYREGMDVEPLKPIVGSGARGAVTVTQAPNGATRSPSEVKGVDSGPRGTISSPRSSSSKLAANTRLPVPPVGVGLPARPNFESSQRELEHDRDRDRDRDRVRDRDNYRSRDLDKDKTPGRPREPARFADRDHPRETDAAPSKKNIDNTETAQVPPGWIVKLSTRSRESYFYHRQTDISCWELTEVFEHEARFRDSVAKSVTPVPPVGADDRHPQKRSASLGRPRVDYPAAERPRDLTRTTSDHPSRSTHRLVDSHTMTSGRARRRSLSSERQQGRYHSRFADRVNPIANLPPTDDRARFRGEHSRRESPESAFHERVARAEPTTDDSRQMDSYIPNQEYRPGRNRDASLSAVPHERGSNGRSPPRDYHSEIPRRHHHSDRPRRQDDVQSPNPARMEKGAPPPSRPIIPADQTSTLSRRPLSPVRSDQLPLGPRDRETTAIYPPRSPLRDERQAGVPPPHIDSRHHSRRSPTPPRSSHLTRRQSDITHRGGRDPDYESQTKRRRLDGIDEPVYRREPSPAYPRHHDDETHGARAWKPAPGDPPRRREDHHHPEMIESRRSDRSARPPPAGPRNSFSGRRDVGLIRPVEDRIYDGTASDSYRDASVMDVDEGRSQRFPHASHVIAETTHGLPRRPPSATINRGPDMARVFPESRRFVREDNARPPGSGSRRQGTPPRDFFHEDRDRDPAKRGSRWGTAIDTVPTEKMHKPVEVEKPTEIIMMGPRPPPPPVVTPSTDGRPSPVLPTAPLNGAREALLQPSSARPPPHLPQRLTDQRPPPRSISGANAVPVSRQPHHRDNEPISFSPPSRAPHPPMGPSGQYRKLTGANDVPAMRQRVWGAPSNDRPFSANEDPGPTPQKMHCQAYNVLEENCSEDKGAGYATDGPQRTSRFSERSPHDHQLHEDDRRMMETSRPAPSKYGRQTGEEPTERHLPTEIQPIQARLDEHPKAPPVTVPMVVDDEPERSPGLAVHFDRPPRIVPENNTATSPTNSSSRNKGPLKLRRPPPDEVSFIQRDQAAEPLPGGPLLRRLSDHPKVSNEPAAHSPSLRERMQPRPNDSDYRPVDEDRDGYGSRRGGGRRRGRR